jgi:hypothetical protein
MRHGLCASLIAIAILLPVDQGAHSAEAATGVYLPGSRGPNAGITPPPGVYFQDDTYFYSGKIGAGTTLATGGARLGAFEGRVVALGGSAGYTFPVGKIPVSTRIKVFRELDVQSRMLGTAGFFTMAFPLMVDSGSEMAAGKAIKAKF